MKPGMRTVMGQRKRENNRVGGRDRAGDRGMVYRW